MPDNLAPGGLPQLAGWFLDFTVVGQFQKHLRKAKQQPAPVSAGEEGVLGSNYTTFYNLVIIHIQKHMYIYIYMIAKFCVTLYNTSAKQYVKSYNSDWVRLHGRDLNGLRGSADFLDASVRGAPKCPKEWTLYCLYSFYCGILGHSFGALWRSRYPEILSHRTAEHTGT